MTDVVRMRMYQVGFGDCFLITFPGPQHMVVDCGSLAGDDHLEDVVHNIAEVTENHIHVVVASHRHGEHINGFASFAKVWNGIAVDEVWMPWVENPENPEASALVREHDRIATLLVDLTGDAEARLAANAKVDQRALDVLIDGFRGSTRRRYLAAQAGHLKTDALKGVHVRVIGPSGAPEAVDQMRLAVSMAGLSVDAITQDEGPFGDKWKIDLRQARRFFGKEARRDALPSREASDITEQLCYWLDKAINNTSLFLLLRCGRVRILLPGDAQAHAWLPFLEHADLAYELQRINFYKVSHHGGHNGTPLRAIESMQSPISLVSSLPEPWPQLPHPPLLKSLARHGQVIRSDRPGRPRGATRGPYWIDYELPV